MGEILSELKRYPVLKNDSLQAYNAADKLLLEHLETFDLSVLNILIVNDHFGALSCNLYDYNITSYTDSFISYKSILLNSKNKIKPINELNVLSEEYDLVLVCLPKNLSFFEDILIKLSHLLKPHTQIICTGMVKHISNGYFDLLQKYIGETSTSLAKKKARLIFSSFEKGTSTPVYPKEIRVDGFDKKFTQYSNIFSREKLDIGTRFFLDHLPKGNYNNILDLGCANGIIGIKAKILNSYSKIHFSDESMMAIKSAKENFAKYFPNDDGKFYWTNSFEDGETNSMDLVLCNPPFHQSHTIGDFIAWQMFKDARRVLKPKGELFVIGNGHLNYHLSLKKLFGSYEKIASNKKFNIFKVIKI